MARKRGWTDEQFVEAAKRHGSIRAVLLDLGLHPTGANYKSMWSSVRRLGVDVSHWTGQAHLRGKTHDWGVKIPIGNVLVKDSKYRGHLKWRLLKEGLLKNECEVCGQGPEWKGKPLVMVLDHINGKSSDHRRENLRLLCPNCNSQSDTFAGRNMGKAEW